MYVLDASAIIAGIKVPPQDAIVPQSVIEEVSDLPVDAEIYRVLHPSEDSVKRVVDVAKRTGDYDLLSLADIHVLALALEEHAAIITDDYAIQNVASYLGLKFLPAQMTGISERRQWKWKCESCGRYFSRYHSECPVCGGKLRRVKKRGEKL